MARKYLNRFETEATEWLSILKGLNTNPKLTITPQGLGEINFKTKIGGKYHCILWLNIQGYNNPELVIEPEFFPYLESEGVVNFKKAHVCSDNMVRTFPVFRKDMMEANLNRLVIAANKYIVGFVEG